MFPLFFVLTIIFVIPSRFSLCHPGVFLLQCSPPHVSGKIFLGTYLFFFLLAEIVTTVPLAVTSESFGPPQFFFPQKLGSLTST